MSLYQQSIKKFAIYEEKINCVMAKLAKHQLHHYGIRFCKTAQILIVLVALVRGKYEGTRENKEDIFWA